MWRSLETRQIFEVLCKYAEKSMSFVRVLLMLVDSWCSWWCSLYWGRRTSKARTCSARASSMQTSQVLNCLLLHLRWFQFLFLVIGKFVTWFSLCGLLDLFADGFRRWPLWCWSSRRRFLAGEFNKGKMFRIAHYFGSVSSGFNSSTLVHAAVFYFVQNAWQVSHSHPKRSAIVKSDVYIWAHFVHAPLFVYFLWNKSLHVFPVWLNYLSIDISMVICFSTRSWLVLPHFICRQTYQMPTWKGHLSQETLLSKVPT